MPTGVERLPSPLPKLRPFTEEGDFWYRQWQDEENSPARRRTAHNLMTGLETAAEEGADAHYLMVREPNNLTIERTRLWYVYSVTLLAYAGLRRAMWDSGATIHDMDGVPRDAADLGTYADFHPNEPFSCGLHARREELTKELGIPWPARPTDSVWLEGDTFYARVFGPATPTQHFATWHQNAYGVPFDTQARVSVVPILKSEVVF